MQKNQQSIAMSSYRQALNDFERVKFIFPSLDKFITMDLNTKIALEDLKFTFSNILKLDLFAKRLEFICSGKNKEILNAKSGLNKQNIVEQKGQIEIQVKFIEEGA